MRAMHGKLQPMPTLAWELPPLDTLVVFEAAARHLSFTRAAAEVSRTQSAVSRQVQTLEERLGVTLFRRLPRGLALTDEGTTLLAGVRQALEALDRSTRALRAETARTVVVSTTAGLAGLWLIPRLPLFTALHPGIDVRISASSAIASLGREGVDIAVRYAPVDRPPPGSVPLFSETVTPLCTPRLARALGLQVPGDLVRATLLRMPPDAADPLQDWPVWLEAMKLADLRPAGVLHISSYDQLIHAALAGQGVALGRFPIASALVRSRRLVAPFAGTVASPRSYTLLVSPLSQGRPEVQAFAAWIRAEARGPGSARRPGRAPASPRA